MLIKHNILFFPRSTTGRLQCKVRWLNNVVEFNVGVTIDISKWNKYTQRIKNSYINKDGLSGYEINRKITELHESLNNYFFNATPTKKELKEHIQSITGRIEEKKDCKTIEYMLSRYIEEVSVIHSWSYNTMKKAKTIKLHISQWEGKEDIKYIDNSFINKYASHLITLGYNNSTIAREISFTRSFIRYLKKNNIIDNNITTDNDIRLKKAENDIYYLTYEELMRVYNLDLSGRMYLQTTRDVFCLQCFTGLRFSDVKNLKKSQIYGDSIHVTMQKTSSSIIIELNKYSRSIVDKYINKEGLCLFKCSSNQKCNECLKTIGKLAELNDTIIKTSYNGGNRIEKSYKKYELLTTHAGRRTFVVNALYLGIPEIVIRKWTGHRDSKSMQPYTKVVDELKEREMKKFDSL